MELFEAYVAELVQWADLAVRVDLVDGRPALGVDGVTLELRDEAISLEEGHPLPGEPPLPERPRAHARAERLGLDWHDPVQRALATWAPDEARLRELLARQTPLG